jgi:hypothetical protein
MPVSRADAFLVRELSQHKKELLDGGEESLNWASFSGFNERASIASIAASFMQSSNSRVFAGV